MKIYDLFEQRSNTTVVGVLNTIADILNGNRPFTSPKLCHTNTASNIDENFPNDEIVLYGYGTTVIHSALVRGDQLISNYAGVDSSVLLPSGKLHVVIGGHNVDELDPVYKITVEDFLQGRW